MRTPLVRWPVISSRYRVNSPGASLWYTVLAHGHLIIWVRLIHALRLTLPIFFLSFIANSGIFEMWRIMRSAFYQCLNLSPKSIGVKYSLIVVFVWGGGSFRPCVLTSLLVKNVFFSFFSLYKYCVALCKLRPPPYH